jgi:hypothetical protein
MSNLKLILVVALFCGLACQKQSVEVTTSLFDGQSFGHWKISSFGSEGEVKLVGKAIQLGYGYPITGIHWEGPILPRDHYSVEFDAMKTEGNDFFVGLTFPVREEYCSLILGGWGGTTCGLSSFDYRDASDNETTFYMDFDLNRWYRVKMMVDGERLITYVDDKKVVDTQIKGRKVHIRPEVDSSRPLGLCSFETVARYRNIVFREL